VERVEVSEERRKGRSWSTVKQVRPHSRDLFYSLHTRPEIADSRDNDTGGFLATSFVLNPSTKHGQPRGPAEVPCLGFLMMKFDPVDRRIPTP
jgi:hypothetical protein